MTEQQAGVICVLAVGAVDWREQGICPVSVGETLLNMRNGNRPRVARLMARDTGPAIGAETLEERVFLAARTRRLVSGKKAVRITMHIQLRDRTRILGERCAVRIQQAEHRNQERAKEYTVAKMPEAFH